MHYLVNPSPRVLASTEEIIGLIRTAGEILDFQIPPDSNPALILDVNPESLCRVAAYRLTNCVGAYNSGRTDSGHEPRWAYKDGAGGWLYHSKAHHNGTRPVGTSRDEVWVRQWIASAPYVGSTPVATPTETEDHPRPAARPVREWAARPEAEPEGHYFGPTRSPMAYHNHTAEHGQALFNLIHPMLGDHTHMPNPADVTLYSRTATGREGRVAIRQGRRWYRFRIFSNGRVSRAGFVGRANAVRWVNAAPRIEAVTAGIADAVGATDLAHWVTTATAGTCLPVPGHPRVTFWPDGFSDLRRFSPVGTNPEIGIAGNYINGTPARRQADSYGSVWTLYRQDAYGNAEDAGRVDRVEDAIAWVENVHEEP